MSSQSSKSFLFRAGDFLRECLIYFALVFGPWAFGTTQPWSIQIMNDAGFALGILWLAGLCFRSRNRRSQRWTRFSQSKATSRWIAAEGQFTWLLAGATIFILLYCLLSAWNARAIYQPDQWSFAFRPAISWLPHSYDQAGSWDAFWKYLGLAGLFWAMRDWLLASWSADAGEGEGFRLPSRLRRLFWVLTLNGTLLAIQGLMQRAEGGNKLLWLIVPRYNNVVTDQFGPYAYRANAAQYFNLLWPAVLGFWWASVNSSRRRNTLQSSRRQNRLAVLLPCVLLMGICPLVTTSRGGAIVLVLNLIMAGAILLMAQWRSSWMAKGLILVLLAAVVGGGALLGWNSLAPRMELINQGYQSREGLYLAGRYMAQDNAMFGTGPGTFGSLYQLYRLQESDEWLGYMHNDWLETVITFGWLGAAPIFMTLLLIFSHWFCAGGIYGDKYFVMLLWVSLCGCLAHACFDFPFQIHSVLTLFLTLAAVLSCLSRRTSTGN